MSRVISIFSTKGGVGRSLIMVNLASYLAQEANKKVCLVDCDLQTAGDIARMINLQPAKSMSELILAMKSDPQNVKIENYITRTSFGFSFLPAVLDFKESGDLDSEKIGEVFGLLKNEYDFILVDAGKSFNEAALNILNHSNVILLPTTPDVISIGQTRSTIHVLQDLNFPLMMLKVILNRSASASSISTQEIMLHLPVEIIANIPSEGKAVNMAINSGTPLTISSPSSKFVQSLKKLGDQLITDHKLYVEHRQVDSLQIKKSAFDKCSSLSKGEDSSEAAEFQKKAQQETNEVVLLKQKIHNRLIDELNLKRLDQKVFSDSEKTKELKDKARVMIANFLTEESGIFIASTETRQELVKEILDEALGYGPLEDLLADPNLTDIMVNNKDEIYTEAKGRLKLTGKKFTSNEQVRVIIERIIAPIGRRIDESVPMVDARLPDGSRVNAIIPPLALTGPALTIRKFRKERYTVDELIKINSLSQQMADFIRAAVLCRSNVIVSGGTGSGKTTILNILSSNISKEERIITLEDAAELKLDQAHWIRLESRPPNIEGKGAITISDLFRNTLRMRPDRILVGECRGSETLDMLQAMNTGHDGSMTTLHANSTHDVLSRLDSMILMSGVELPVRAIKEMIASAIDLIVHTSRLSDGSRRIVAITEIAGMRDENHIELKDIFLFKQTGVDDLGNVLGYFHATGYIPKVLEEIKIRGINLTESIFAESSG
ncbi:MAG: ATPase, T2SS/T4P/T4SS family [Candidatus Omnitrophota bacterium]